MNIIKCTTGHYFDADAYERCPHCGAARAFEGAGRACVVEEQPRKSFWKRKDSKKQKYDPATTIDIPSPTSAPTSNFSGSDFFNAPTEPFAEEEEYIPAAPNKVFQDQKTLDFWDDVSSGRENQEESYNSNIQQEEIKADTFSFSGIDPEITEEVDNIPKPSTEDKIAELKNEIQNVSASNDGKTMSYFSMVSSAKTNNEAPESRSTANKNTSSASDPVVGWLVCVKGVHFGESFYIGTGKNAIGRNSDNKIVLWADNSVSRVKHALIVYEPKKRQFYIQPGDSSGLTYLNDEYITESKLMKKHDVIELGESKFVFIPLCDDVFSWEDYISKE